MNEKNPNKQLYILENKDITWEYDEDSLTAKIIETLDAIAEGSIKLSSPYQPNLGTKYIGSDVRKSIAEAIVDKL
tara:strand:- start:122 stop:346 length:225 start_codon:yes stop_codon:yes gene_type:complete